MSEQSIPTPSGQSQPIRTASDPSLTEQEAKILTHLDQYEMLRTEIDSRQQETSRILTSTILAVGAVYAWLLTHPQNLTLSYGYYLPTCLFVLSALYLCDSTLRIMHIARYLSRIEEAAFGDDSYLPGWERYKRERNGIAVIFNAVTIILYASMIIGSLALAKQLRINASSPQTQSADTKGTNQTSSATQRVSNIVPQIPTNLPPLPHK